MSGMEKKIHDRLMIAVEDGVFPGAVAGFNRDGQQRVIVSGTLDGTIDVKVDSIYDVASITKAIPISSLALQLIEQKQLDPDDLVQRFIPEFAQKEVTIRHLLTQTLVLGYHGMPLQLSKLKNRSPEKIMSLIYHADLLAKPGTKFAYTNSASILLGQVIERLTKSQLDELAEEIFFKPLGMSRTSFHPEKFPIDEIAPSENDPWREGIVRGVVHDESASILSKNRVVGSAGLFSTVSDLLIFLSMLLGGGVYKGRRYFTKESVIAMTTNQISGIGGFVGLGWELNQPQYMGKFVHPKMFGKTGFTGCVVVADPLKMRGMVLLSNFTFPKRKGNATLLNEVRRAVADIVFGD